MAAERVEIRAEGPPPVPIRIWGSAIFINPGEAAALGELEAPSDAPNPGALKRELADALAQAPDEEVCVSLGYAETLYIMYVSAAADVLRLIALGQRAGLSDATMQAYTGYYACMGVLQEFAPPQPTGQIF